MLWSSSSSIHRDDTPAPWAAASRSCSSDTSPAATAAASRTSAAVAGSSGPWLILRLPHAGSSIFLLLEPPIYAQLADGLAPGVEQGPGGERRRSRPQPQLLQHGRQRERRRQGMPVGHLDGHAQ